LKLGQERFQERRNLLEKIVQSEQNGSFDVDRAFGYYSDERTGDLGNKWFQGIPTCSVNDVGYGKGRLGALGKKN
jgi:hypothetical protein